jgi:hypothetical protein
MVSGSSSAGFDTSRCSGRYPLENFLKRVDFIIVGRYINYNGLGL